MEPWLTTPEVAKQFKISDNTLDRWIKSKYLINGIHYGGSGKMRRFDAAMMDCAVRFQDDPKAHQLAIEEKRQSLEPKRKSRKVA